MGWEGGREGWTERKRWGKGEGEGGKEEGSGDEADLTWEADEEENCPHGKCPHLAFALPFALALPFGRPLALGCGSGSGVVVNSFLK